MTSLEQHPAPAATWQPVDHAVLVGAAFEASPRQTKFMTCQLFLEAHTRVWPAPTLLLVVEQVARVAIQHHTPS
jgi:hypothetical protein